MLMDKKTYYVSVPNKTVSEALEISHRPLEIIATPMEATELESLLQSNEVIDAKESFRTPIASYTSDDKEISREYHAGLIRIYRMIYDLGTVETKSFIEEMGILTR